MVIDNDEQVPYLVFLINRSHSFLTFRLRDDFPSVLHDDLVGFECAVAANTVSTVQCFDHLDPDVVLASGLGPLLDLIEASITTIGSQAAITVIAFVEHVAVLTIIITARFRDAHTFRELRVFVRPPYAPRLADEHICEDSQFTISELALVRVYILLFVFLHSLGLG